jgi:tRNA pseudouridine38-40 synthase
MRNVRVRVAYDGSKFFGWQRQAGFSSVQEALEDALAALVSERVVVHGAGRTDTGVHALGQVANFHVDTRLDDDRLLHALNAHLVEGVVLTGLETCRDDFQAQFDARGKRYLYRVVTTRFAPPFARELYHWTPEVLDLGAMREAARSFVGERDFTSLASAGSPRRSNVRRIHALHLVARRTGFGLVVQGDGFLYNMVRTLAGTLLDVGRGKILPAHVPDILAARDRSSAGPTAPAAGLYLLSVLYDEPVLAALPTPGRSVRRALGFLANTPQRSP